MNNTCVTSNYTKPYRRNHFFLGWVDPAWDSKQISIASCPKSAAEKAPPQATFEIWLWLDHLSEQPVVPPKNAHNKVYT